MHKKTVLLFEKMSASIFKSQEGSSQTIRRSSSKRFQDLQWTHDTNTRHRSEMNMIAERAVRRVREGTATAMVQSGLHGGGTVRRNFVATGGTRTTKWPMERQHTRMYVVYSVTDVWTRSEQTSAANPSLQKDESRPHPFGKKQILHGILMGLCLVRRGGWSGDLVIADCEDLENLSASEIVRSERFKHQDVAQERTLSFPCADGSLRLFNPPRPHR